MKDMMQLSTAPQKSRDAVCGIPIDAEYFDAFSISRIPEKFGATVVLATFTLPPQYCGILLCFSQFTDAFARSPENIETPGLVWMLQSNRMPMHPYIKIESIINPWGYGSFEFGARIEEGSIIEMVVRNTGYVPAANPQAVITKIGGRIMGRYWYNPSYGSVGRHGP